MGRFKRTNYGTSNLRLFYDVDVVVYLEGGNKSYTMVEVLDNKFSHNTEDIAFWNNIFKKYKSTEKLKYKSVGSKKTLLDLSEKLINGSISNVYVAMDNEFDEIHRKQIKHSNIFYTNGYSYENDVWNAKTVISVLKELTASEVDIGYIEKGYKSFERAIKMSVFADAYLFKRNQSFFPRKKGHLFCIECNSAIFPDVKTVEINKIFHMHSLKESAVRSYGYRYRLSVNKFCFGHLLADFCCQIINHYLKVFHDLSSVRKEILYRMGINKYFNYQYEQSHIEQYYTSQFA